MNDWLVFIFMFLSGALLSAIYLAGLWLTVQHIQREGRPALWLITSWVVRVLLLIVAFYFILGDGHWQHLLAALAGFVTLRILTIRRIQNQVVAVGNDPEKMV